MKQDFQHPILTLQIVRLASLLTGATDKASVFEIGRITAAASGGLLVFSAATLPRRAGDLAALGTCPSRQAREVSGPVNAGN
ncbi:MAG: hypothetical protein WA441_13040 [Methyloceanibacter sp.]